MYLIVSIISLCLPVVLFVFKAIGVYKMSVARNFKKPYLAFIPFVSTYYMGLIAGEMTIFGRKFKNLGIPALLFSIAYFALEIAYYIILIVSAGFMAIFKSSVMVSKTIKACLSVIDVFSGIANVLAVICTYFILCDILKQYQYRPVTITSLIAVVLGIEAFFLFYYANKPYHDKADNARYVYTYNPYGQNPYNPYGQNPNAAQPPFEEKPIEEPFGEFKSDLGEEPFGEAPNEPFGEFSKNNAENETKKDNEE